jgi:hypothetical protein
MVKNTPNGYILRGNLVIHGEFITLPDDIILKGDYWGRETHMNSQKTILYIGSAILVIIGAYTVYMGQTSQGVIWFILGVIFLSISSQLGRPIKAVKVRKMIILLCAIILLGIGAFMLYFGEFMAGIAWIVAGILGLLISFMLVGHKGVLDPN